MGIFLFGILVGIIIGIRLTFYRITILNRYDPNRFDEIIMKLRERLNQLDN